MPPSTLNIASYEPRSGGTLVPATVTYDGATAHLLPSASLAANTTYTVSISTEAKDVHGVPLSETKTWTFTTIATAVTGPAMLNLGTAAFYSILAQSAVANSGTSEVIGDMALTPGASSAITGFALSAPTSYATSAYVFGNVNGLTLLPGLYRFDGDVTIPVSVSLTGGENDIWIFQVAGNISVADRAVLLLRSGAQASNVYWQVAGQATLGAGSIFRGIVLSRSQIIMNGDAVIQGRLCVDDHASQPRVPGGLVRSA